MSRRRGLLAAALTMLVLSATSAPAQTPEPGCAGDGALAAACQLSGDYLSLMLPQLGTALAGGAAVSGEGGNLGRFGRLSLALRSTGFRMNLPDVPAPVAVPPGEPEPMPVLRTFSAVTTVDAALGLWSGVPLEISNVGGVDFLASFAFLPTFSTEGARVAPPGGNARFNYGVRVGVLQESYGVPGVAVTFMRRALPTADLVAADGAGDTAAVRRARVDADSWRLVAAKHFIALGLVAGIGQDFLTAEGTLEPVTNAGGVRQALTEPVAVRREMTRVNGFLSATVNFSIVRFVAELGGSFGGDAPTVTQFSGYAPDDPILYGSLGVRVGF